MLRIDSSLNTSFPGHVRTTSCSNFRFLKIIITWNKIPKVGDGFYQFIEGSALQRGRISAYGPSCPGFDSRPFQDSLDVTMSLKRSIELILSSFTSQMALLVFNHNSSPFTSPVTSIHTGACDDRHWERECTCWGTQEDRRTKIYSLIQVRTPTICVLYPLRYAPRASLGI